METCAPYARTAIQCDLYVAWTAIADATVDDEARVRSWTDWLEYSADCRHDPYM